MEKLSAHQAGAIQIACCQLLTWKSQLQYKVTFQGVVEISLRGGKAKAVSAWGRTQYARNWEEENTFGQTTVPTTITYHSWRQALVLLDEFKRVQCLGMSLGIGAGPPLPLVTMIYTTHVHLELACLRVAATGFCVLKVPL